MFGCQPQWLEQLSRKKKTTKKKTFLWFIKHHFQVLFFYQTMNESTLSSQDEWLTSLTTCLSSSSLQMWVAHAHEKATSQSLRQTWMSASTIECMNDNHRHQESLIFTCRPEKVEHGQFNFEKEREKSKAPHRVTGSPAGVVHSHWEFEVSDSEQDSSGATSHCSSPTDLLNSRLEAFLPPQRRNVSATPYFERQQGTWD